MISLRNDCLIVEGREEKKKETSKLGLEKFVNVPLCSVQPVSMMTMEINMSPMRGLGGGDMMARWILRAARMPLAHNHYSAPRDLSLEFHINF